MERQGGYLLWDAVLVLSTDLIRNRMQWEEKHMSYNFDVRNGPVSNSWFKGGTTNMAYNCLDRNIEKGLGDNTCFIWEGNEPGVFQETPIQIRKGIKSLRSSSCTEHCIIK